MQNLPERDVEAIATDWSIWARPDQMLPAGDWRAWLCQCGRGWGKTRTGAGATHEHARHPEWLDGGVMILGAPTYAKLHGEIVEGPSGVLASSPSDFRPRWFPGKETGLLIWPNGVRGVCLSGDKPRSFRGPNAAWAWLDELAHYDRPDEVWDNLQYALRLGVARCMVTTTPLPIPVIDRIANDARTVITRGSTYDNAANLAAAFLAYVRERYEGTRLGRQEIWGEVLRDAPGALWKSENIDRNRLANVPRQTVRLVVACDPAVTDPTRKTEAERERLAETGITVQAIDRHGHGYLLEDRSGQYSPEQWGEILVMEFERWQADCIVGEVNNGGDLVEANVRAVARTMGKRITFKAVRATRGKQIRAEPISTLAERDKIHHVGTFPELEKQLTTWQPGDKSPDRLDAYVWGFTELFEIMEPAKDVGPISAYG